MKQFKKHTGLTVICPAILVFLSLIMSAQYSYAGVPHALVQQRAALVTIYSADMGGKHTGTQKGFFVDKDGIIAVQYEAKAPTAGNGRFVRTAEGSYLQIDRVVAVDKMSGIALLKVDLRDPPIIRLFPDRVAVSGETVFIPGSGAGLRHSVIEGITAVSPDGREVILLPPPVPSGINGSPVFDREGKVVGMLARDMGNGTVVNRLVPIANVANLLDKYRKSGPPSLDDPTSTEEPGFAPDELEMELEKAKSLVQEDPENAKAFIILGWAYSRLGMYADAIEAYRNAASLRPDSAGIYNNIGVVYGMDMGMYDRAVAEFQRALRLKPDYDEARYNLAIAYVFSDDRDSALKEYGELKKTDPDRAAKLFDFIHEEQKEEDSNSDGGAATE